MSCDYVPSVFYTYEKLKSFQIRFTGGGIYDIYRDGIRWRQFIGEESEVITLCDELNKEANYFIKNYGE